MSDQATPEPTRDRESRAPARRWAGLAVVLLVGAVAAVLLALIVGALNPQLPRIGWRGLQQAGQIVRFTLVALVVAVIALWLWWRRRDWLRSLVAVTAVLALLGGGYITTRQLLTAQAEGVNLNPLQLVGLGEPATRAPDADVVYTRDQGEDLRVAIWRPPQASTPAPVVVYLHGGGWIMGGRADETVAAHASWLADRGFVVASVDYSLSGPQRHLWNAVEPQLGCALSWVAGNAAQYGGDAGRLGLVGDSAGGNIALNVGYRANAGTLESVCGGSVPRVAAVSALYPVADPVGFHDNPNPATSELATTMTEQYLGGPPQQYPQRYTAITPSTHLTAQAPATLLTVPTADSLVPPQGAYDLAAELERRQVPGHLIRVYPLDHSFDHALGSIGTQTWRQATVSWLRDHGLG